MKKFKITEDLLNDILDNSENVEYLMWINGESIDRNEILTYFHLTKYPNGQFNFEHNEVDYRIEDLILSENIELIEI